jgi:hypothetical protein
LTETTTSYGENSTKASSSWLTVLIFIVIAHFNPEVLTGSTRIEGYFTFLNLALNMPFYGLQVAIIADLAARFHFRWRTIYLVGLIYGIFEEGFAVMTMVSSTPPGFTNQLRLFGLNVLWATNIDTFHAIVSVLSSVLIIKLIFPQRVSEPFLRRRHYVVMVSALDVIYFGVISFATSTYVPQLSAVLILVGACLFLAYLAKRSEKSSIVKSSESPTGRQYLKWSLGLVLAMTPLVLFASLADRTGLLPFGIGLASGYFFYVLFGKMDADPDLSQQKQLLLFSVFVGFWTFFGLFFRTPLSSVVAVAGVATQIYLAWRKIP